MAQAFCDEAFEDTQLDSASRIMQMFTKQNNRVLKIFETSEDSDEVRFSFGKSEKDSKMKFVSHFRMTINRMDYA